MAIKDADPTKTAYSELTPAQRAAMTQKEKTTYLAAARKFQMAEDAKARAATNPMFDVTNRPEAPEVPGMIQYYSWIGDQWKLYQAADTPENRAKYGSRSEGGQTKATFNSSAGANTLKSGSTSTDVKNNGLSVSAPQFPNDPTDLIAMMNRLNELSTKSRTGTAGIGPDKGKEFKGGLTPEEIAEYDRLYINVQEGLKTGRPVYGIKNPDGTTTLSYDDPNPSTGNKVVSSNGFPPGSINSSFVPGSISTDGTGSNTLGTVISDENKAKRKSAYDDLYNEFDQYGLGSLVSDIKNILLEGSYEPSEFSLKVRGTDAYKKRFIANEARLAKGLKVLSPAEYIAMEDKYQEVMRQYGLPESYYAKTGTGIQEGFNKLIENDVSNLELEDRISTAQKRVINANPEVTQAIRQFYPDITNADILAYTLDPKNAIENIKRKVTAAEIGGAAIKSGLQTGVARAEELQKYGVDQAAAEKGFGTIAGGLQRGSQLAAIYGEDPYNQATAETEVFNLTGAQEARKQRQKITGLEKSTFGGQSGASSSALVRDRAGAY